MQRSIFDGARNVSGFCCEDKDTEECTPFSFNMQRLLTVLSVVLIIASALSLSTGSLNLPGFTDQIVPDNTTRHPFEMNKQTEGNADVKSIPMPDAVTAKNTKSFGTGDREGKDATSEIQAMINSLPDSGGEVLIPSGTYLIDAEKSIWLKSNITLTMAPDAILKAIPNNARSYAVLQIADVQNVKVSGGIIVGERNEHLGSEGEWGMGIRITGSKDILVQNTVANDCWGDGFYIGTGTTGNSSERVSLIDVKADNNRRQGISLISGRNIEIIRPSLTHTHGTPPGAGLDIEPNRVTDIIENVHIIDPYTADNTEGIIVSLHKLNGTLNPISIKIINHRDDGSGRGMLISSADAVIPGILSIENAEWVNSKKNGLSIQNHNYQSYAIEIYTPRIIDANRSISKSPVTGSAVAIYHFSGRIGIIGNVSILNPMIMDTGEVPRTLSAFYISNSMDQEIRNLSIIDPEIGGSISRNIPDKLRNYVKFTQ